jgi:hypothetical protein
MAESTNHDSLEQALSKLEGDLDVAMKGTRVVLTSLKKFGMAARVGDLRELRKTRDAAEQAVATLQQQLANLREDWNFDDERYLAGEAFLTEVREAAEQVGLRVYEQDGQLYCYPFLVRVLPGDKAVLIDKNRERRLRPKVLVAHLKDLQNKPVRFKSEPFLEALYVAYRTVVATRDPDLLNTRVVVPLTKIYELLTLLPGSTRDYSRAEFARDIYLLDRSGVTTTKDGSHVTFPTATGTKSAGNFLSVITQEGREKKYYGILFSAVEATDEHRSS